jgi:metallophosphoesterase superfamily enzyme
MEESLTYTFGGTRCRLYFDGSLHIPSLNTLFISDVHLGKSASFRKDGIPSPIAVHKHGFARLKRALDRHPESDVVFLGDLFEGAQNKETEELRVLLESYMNRTFHLVLGNHDYDAPQWPCLETVRELKIGPFLCLHEPPGCDFVEHVPFTLEHAEKLAADLGQNTFLLCGHLHPGATLKGKGRFRAKMKAFFFNSWIGILPAFGAMTGHYSLAEPGEYFGMFENSVVALGKWPKTR